MAASVKLETVESGKNGVVISVDVFYKGVGAGGFCGGVSENISHIAVLLRKLQFSVLCVLFAKNVLAEKACGVLNAAALCRNYNVVSDLHLDLSGVKLV